MPMIYIKQRWVEFFVECSLVLSRFFYIVFENIKCAEFQVVKTYGHGRRRIFLFHVSFAVTCRFYAALTLVPSGRIDGYGLEMAHVMTLLISLLCNVVLVRATCANLEIGPEIRLNDCVNYLFNN